MKVFATIVALIATTASAQMVENPLEPLLFKLFDLEAAVWNVVT